MFLVVELQAVAAVMVMSRGSVSDWLLRFILGGDAVSWHIADYVMLVSLQCIIWSTELNVRVRIAS